MAHIHGYGLESERQNVSLQKFYQFGAAARRGQAVSAAFRGQGRHVGSLSVGVRYPHVSRARRVARVVALARTIPARPAPAEQVRSPSGVRFCPTSKWPREPGETHHEADLGEHP